MTAATIYPEIAQVTEHYRLPDNQFLIRLRVPECAARVQPGNFIHLSCSSDRYALKRPFSVLRANPSAGTIDILYKTVGTGTGALSQVNVGDQLHSLGPIGNAFKLSSDKSLPLLLGGGVGIPPIVFFAEVLHAQREVSPMVLMGSEIAFPFATHSTEKTLPGIPSSSCAVMTELDTLGVHTRLCSKQGYAGFYAGYIHQLAACWVQQLTAEQRAQVEVFACGPEPMLRAVAQFSQQYELVCQLSLEEYMACAVGGCAGCTVKITDASGTAHMKRVCVDGPIFDASSVY